LIAVANRLDGRDLLQDGWRRVAAVVTFCFLHTTQRDVDGADWTDGTDKKLCWSIFLGAMILLTFGGDAIAGFVGGRC
jgi:hypothetical protein